MPRRPLFSHERRVADPLDAPAGNRIQRGGTQRFAGSQAETGVVPWAPNGVADDQTFDERAVIVRAVGAKGKDRIARSNEQHVFFIDAAQDLPSIRKVLNGESAPEVGQCVVGHS